MDPSDFIRGIFGFPRHPGRQPPFDDNHPDLRDPGRFPGQPMPPEDFEDHQEHNNIPGFQVKVITDPDEIHKFFDQQISQIFQGFGLGGGGFGSFPFGQQQIPPGFGDESDDDEGKNTFIFGGPSFNFGQPSIPFGPHSNPFDQPKDNPSAGSRDFMLKDGFGYDKNTSSTEKKDKDMGDDLTVNELDKLFEKKSPNSVVPRNPNGGSFWMEPNQQPMFRSSSSFFSSKTVRLPDGSIEKHETKRNSDGHEVTTITKTVGDQTHTIQTVKKPDGSEERKENFINDSPNSSSTNEITKPWLNLFQGPKKDIGKGSFWQDSKETDKSLFERFFGPK